MSKEFKIIVLFLQTGYKHLLKSSFQTKIMNKILIQLLCSAMRLLRQT